MAQLVERVLGKDEVTGSIPVSSFVAVSLLKNLALASVGRWLMSLIWHIEGTLEVQQRLKELGPLPRACSRG